MRIRLRSEVLSVDGTLGLAVLAQDRIEEGTNEITVIPHLLALLDLEETIITVDAIGCQTEIAEAIVNQQADYVLAVKTNQERLFEDAVDAFEPSVPAIPIDYHQTINKGHATSKSGNAGRCPTAIS